MSAWTRRPLGEVASIQLGKMLDAAKNRGRPLPYLRNVNVRWDAFDLSDLQEMRFESDELDRFTVRCGDLVVCEGGEPGRCAIWQDDARTIQYQKALHRIRSGPELEPRWIFYSLRQLAESGELASFFTGTTIKHLTGAALNRVPIAVPPVEIQRRIVARLDAQLAQTRAAREQLEAVPALVEQYRQSVLAAAFRGDLTEGRERWPICRLDALGGADRPAVKAGPFGSSLKKSFYVKSGYRVYGQEQVIADDFSVGDYFIDAQRFALLGSCEVRPGDVLVSLVGTFGKASVVPPGTPPGIINPRLVRLSLDPSRVDPHFVKLFLRSPAVQVHFERVAHGGTMGVLNATSLSALEMPVPPLGAQRAIVVAAERLWAVTRLVDEQLESAVDCCKVAERSLLAKAVRGEFDLDGSDAEFEYLQDSAQKVAGKALPGREDGVVAHSALHIHAQHSR